MTPEQFDSLGMPSDERVVLEWLCRHESRVIYFDEISESLNRPRSEVEITIGKLRRKEILAVIGPEGERLDQRVAYLKKESPYRG